MDKDDLLLKDKEIRAIKARELVIYRKEDIQAYPPDRAIIQAQLKKVVKWMEQLSSRDGSISTESEVWQEIKKIAGIK